MYLLITVCTYMYLQCTCWYLIIPAKTCSVPDTGRSLGIIVSYILLVKRLFGTSTFIFSRLTIGPYFRHCQDGLVGAEDGGGLHLGGVLSLPDCGALPGVLGPGVRHRHGRAAGARQGAAAAGEGGARST